MDVLIDLRQLLGSMEKLLEVSCVLHWTPNCQKEMKMGKKFLEEVVCFGRRLNGILKIYIDGDDPEVRECIGSVLRGLVLKTLDYLKLLVFLEHERDGFKSGEELGKVKGLVMSKLEGKRKENDEIGKKSRSKVCQEILQTLLTLLGVHSSLRQTPFAIIDRAIYSSMLKLMIEMVTADLGTRQFFLEKEILKEILRVKIAFDKKNQKNLEEQIRNPTAFREGHDLLKKLITI
jgi:hypothetical protein